MTPSKGKSGRESARLWRWRLALLLAPLLVLWRQDNPLFTGVGFIDPWLYYGFFRNLAEFKDTLFFGTYYGSRLSWLIPGWAVHSVLPPLAASAVLHLIVHSTAVLALFGVLRAVAGVRAAFVAALLFSVHPWLWMATGWDYLDGAGMAYCLVALACFAGAAERETERWRLCAAGAALAGAVYTNLFLVALAPLPPLFYLARRLQLRGKVGVRDLVSLGLWVGAGGVAVTLLLGVVNLALDGHFFFYAPSVLAAMRLMSERNPWFTTVWGAHGLAPFLWVTALAVAASLAGLADLRRGSRVAGIFGAQFLAAMAICLALQSMGTPALGLSFYASYLMPFAFLAFGAVFFGSAEAMSPRAYFGLCAAIALAAAVLWGDFRAEWIPVWPMGAGYAAAICAVLSAAAILLRRKPAGAVLAVAGLIVLNAEVRAPYLDPHGNRAGEERLVFTRARIEAERKGQPVRVWYAETDPAAPDHRALQSTYIGTRSSLGTAFPGDKCDDTVEPGTLVAVSSSAPGTAATAHRALSACWSPLGMEPEAAGADTVQGTLGGFDVVRFRASLTPGGRAPVETPPFGKWTPSAGAQAGNEAGRVKLRTQSAGYEIALLSPAFAAPAAGRYRFALRYRPGSGHIAFGAVGAGDREWKRQDVEEHRSGGEEELSFWLPLEAGEQIRLAVANCHFASRPSSAVLGAVTAVRVVPAAATSAQNSAAR